MPDSLIYKLLRKKYFKVNDKKAEGIEILKEGDKVSVFLGEDTYEKYVTKKEVKTNVIKKIDNIVYEDDNIIVYNKPVGMLSQGVNKSDISVNSILNGYVNSNSYIYNPSIVNRLDRNTCGLIIFAKTYIASREISKMIKEEKLIKHYSTIVNGIVKNDSDTLTHLYKKDERNNMAIIKDYNDKVPDGYSIVKLKYKVLKRIKEFTYLDIELITGKSHQIRAELSYIGHPIICDRKYMSSKLYDENVTAFNKKTQELCCYMIRFSTFDNDLLKYLDNKEIKLPE